MSMEAQPKLYVWFESKDMVGEEVGYLCLEWYGGYEPNAAWYAPFWKRLRMEMGFAEPNSPSGWLHGTGGMAGKVWRTRLTNAALRTPQTPQQALDAVRRAVKAFNQFPHNVGIIMETI